MSFDYSLFKKHISSFNHEKYLESFNNDFKNKYNNFYDFYLKIIKEEIENTKQLNAKFSSNLKDKSKYYKFNRAPPPIDFKKVCSFDSIDDENEKLNIIIRTYLNKISNDTYEKVTDQLIEKLSTNKNTNIFKILSEEIVNKCIFDYKYRNLYINLCSKIWNNKKIHYNLVIITKLDNKYYAEFEIENIKEKLGPYDSIDKIKEIVFKKINFKNFFIDFLQKLYYNKDLNFNHLNDEEFFNIKKKTLLLVELLSILFIEKHINFDIINLIIIDLLHQDDNFEVIKEIEFELLHVMIKFIHQNNKSFKFIEYKKIIDKFKSILESILNNSNNHNNLITKRSNYFINEIIIIFNKILNNEKYINSKNSENNLDTLMNLSMKNNSKDFFINFNDLNDEDKNKIIIKIVNKYLENNKNNFLLKILKQLNNEFTKNIHDLIIKIIENLDDIILDIPDIGKNVENFINELNLDKNLIDSLNQKLELINNESDDEDFSFR